jgi:intracellular sulfur oxidation DsrE/DsrF family protein
VADQVVEFLAAGVVFDVCQNTMTEKNIRTDMLIQGVQIVPAGVIHVAKRQAEGWSYIKAGF